MYLGNRASRTTMRLDKYHVPNYQKTGTSSYSETVMIPVASEHHYGTPRQVHVEALYQNTHRYETYYFSWCVHISSITVWVCKGALRSNVCTLCIQSISCSSEETIPDIPGTFHIRSFHHSMLVCPQREKSKNFRPKRNENGNGFYIPKNTSRHVNSVRPQSRAATRRREGT